MDVNKILFEICRNIKNGQDIDNELQELITSPYTKSVSETLYYIIWATPVYSHQIILIDAIIRLVFDNGQRDLADYVIENFITIEPDRRDKFYYLLSKSWHLYSFHELLSINDQDVLEAVAKHLNNSERPVDWEDTMFLDFLCKCKPWIAAIFTEIRISKIKVKEYLKKIEIHKENREALFRLVQDVCF